MLDPPPFIDPEKGQALVRLARSTLADQFQRELPPAEKESLRQALADGVYHTYGGTFVTLKLNGKLRGCIGTLNPIETLVEGVRRNALHAGFQDPRFSPLADTELDQIRIEVSVLTQPVRLEFTDSEDLLRRLRTHVDGVVIRKGYASATFLPQVWEQLPKKEDFLGQLCLKAGLPRDVWKRSQIDVSTYQVQVFEEQE